MKFNKKGISPLIATVLVIGFTIVLAGVVMQFIMPLFVQSGEKAKSDAALMRMCSDFGVSLAVKTAVYDSTGKVFNVVVDNPTSTDIQGLSVKLYFTDGSAIGCSYPTDIDKEKSNPLITANGIKSIKLPEVGITGCEAAELTDEVLQTIKSVEVTPSVWVENTKEVKTCTSATVSKNV